MNKIQTITTPTGEKMAILPLSDYEALLDAIDAAQALAEARAVARGRRERNTTLSQRRAESVVRFLVDRGRVEASRLEAHGYGPDRPRVQNASTAAEHAQNRRVEFNIPGGAEGVQQQQREAGNDSTDR